MLALATSGIVSLAILLQPHTPAIPAQAPIPPYLTGWGGVRLDEAGSNITSPRFDYVLVIMMENKDYTDIIGNSCCPYINSLANQYSLATNFHDSDNRGSLPNYLALTTGNGQLWAGCNAPPSLCTGFAPVNPTIIDRLDGNGVSWKAYMEGMPSNCYAGNTDYYSGPNGVYYPRHDPFIYYASVINNPVDCNKVVPAGTNDSLLLNDLSSTITASSFMWLTPNGCNDMHDCNAAAGDNYLAGLVPKILSSNIFKSQNAALFIVWDEGSISSHIPAILAGPAVNTNYQSSISYQHFSFLKTIELDWNLQGLTVNDSYAQPLNEFFKTTWTGSDMELHMMKFRSLGYNTIRVDFNSLCSLPAELGPYSATNLRIAINLAMKYNMWIIIDMHGYHDIETSNQSCWLSNWKTIVQQLSSSYSQIIWEPENEQNGDNVTLLQLSAGYQAWINQARSLGDNHWIIVGNQCIGTCSSSPFVAALWPTVTDPLHEIMINWHSYMYYPYWEYPHSISAGSIANTNGWTNATAETVANLWLNVSKTGTSLTSWRAINTEIGADPITGTPPDNMIKTQLTGCDAYTLTTLHFVQTLVKLYAVNGISWTGWAAGSWSTSGLSGCGSVQGVSYGALQPGQGWGTQLFPQGKTLSPPVLTGSFSISNTTIITGQLVSFPASATGGVPPYAYSWNLGDGKNSTGITANHVYMNPGTYTVELTITDGAGKSATYNHTITVTGSPLQPPGGQPNNGNGSCLLCPLIPTTTLVVSTVAFLGIGILAGLGLYYVRFLARKGAEKKELAKITEKIVQSIETTPRTVRPRIGRSNRRKTPI